MIQYLKQFMSEWNFNKRVNSNKRYIVNSCFNQSPLASTIKIPETTIDVSGYCYYFYSF